MRKKIKLSEYDRDRLILAGVAIATAALVCFFGAESAFARDIGSATKTYSTTLKGVAKDASLGGICAGGAGLAFPGLERYGKVFLAGGLACGLIAYGSSTYSTLLNTVFGGG